MPDLHGVYYWVLNIQIKQLPTWVTPGWLAIIWTLWGFACFYVDVFTDSWRLFIEVHFWFYDSVRAFARAAPENNMYSNILHAYNFLMLNGAHWISSFIFVAVLSAKTGSRKLWFILYWTSLNVLTLAVQVDSLIYDFSVPGIELRWALHAWYTSMASMFIVQPIFICLGFKAGDKLRMRIKGSSSKGEGYSSIPA